MPGQTKFELKFFKIRAIIAVLAVAVTLIVYAFRHFFGP
jgi:hypothetical protein